MRPRLTRRASSPPLLSRIWLCYHALPGAWVHPDGEDILQEALLRAWAHRRQFDPNRAPLLTWLLTIVANEARRSRGRRKLSLPIPLMASVPAIATDERLDLESATTELPKRQRLAVDCFYYIGLSVAQTAAVMGCSEGNVKSTLSDARKRLRLELEKR